MVNLTKRVTHTTIIEYETYSYSSDTEAKQHEETMVRAGWERHDSESWDGVHWIKYRRDTKLVK